MDNIIIVVFIKIILTDFLIKHNKNQKNLTIG